MNKVAKYLNEHLSGEVASQDFALSQVEVDNGLLARRPEMIVRAANMNDIRKVMRFCSQLAEKSSKIAKNTAPLKHSFGAHSTTLPTTAA